MNNASTSLLINQETTTLGTWPDESKQTSPPSLREKSMRPAPEWLNRGQIPGLDGLRALAVVLVLLNHGHHTPGYPSGDLAAAIALRGGFGVDIFFVISGFLITTLLMREIERNGRLNLKRFFVRRSLRILPAYACLIGVIAMMQSRGKAHLETVDWFCAITYTSNFLNHPAWEIGHTWSLAIEEHFYLLWPAALFIGGIIGGWRVALGCVFGCWFIRTFIALVVPHLLSRDLAVYCASMAENWTFTRLDTISMGCLLAMACRVERFRLWLDRLTHPVLMIAYFGMICLALKYHLNAKLLLCFAYTMNAVCVALLIWGIIRSEGILKRLFNNMILSRIGVVSYSIYLWQQLFINPQRTGWIYEFPQNIGLSLAVAMMSYWLIETPFNRLKDHVAG